MATLHLQQFLIPRPRSFPDSYIEYPSEWCEARCEVQIGGTVGVMRAGEGGDAFIHRPSVPLPHPTHIELFHLIVMTLPTFLQWSHVTITTWKFLGRRGRDGGIRRLVEHVHT